MNKSEEERAKAGREAFDAYRALKPDGSDQSKEALQLLNQCLASNATHAVALQQRATLLSRLGDYYAASIDMSVLIQLEYSSSVAPDLRRLAGLYGARATMLFKSGREQQGLADFERAMELEPDNGTWLYEAGYANLRRGNSMFAGLYFQNALNPQVTSKMSETIKFRNLVCLGVCRLNSGEVGHAIRTFNKAKELMETPGLSNLLGLALYRNRSYRAAADSFLRAIEQNVQKHEYHLHLGISSFQVGDASDALRQLSEAILYVSDNAELLFFRGCVQLQLNMLPQAQLDFNEAIRLDPQPKYYYSIGLLHKKSGHNAEAKQAFKSVLNQDPSFSQCYVELGMIAHEEGNLSDALVMYHHALEQRQTPNAALSERVGLVYTDMNYHENALRYFEVSQRLEPDNGLYTFRVAAAQVCSGNPLGALASVERAIDQLGFAEPRALHCRAVALKLLARPSEALEWANQAVSQEPDNDVYCVNRAEIFFALGRFQDAVSDAERVMRSAGGSASAKALYLRARARHALGNYTEALHDLDTAAQQLPALKTSHTFWYARGVVDAYLELTEEAEKDFDRAIVLCTQLPAPPLEYYMERGKARQMLGNYSGAVEDFSVILGRSPKNFNARVLRSLAYKALGQFDRATQDFHIAAKEDTTEALSKLEPNAFFSLSYVKFGNPGEEVPEESSDSANSY